ncbi:MAG TPA: beta-phosphoglucomutase family hydrolase [Phycisphaerae bacterium]|nr:beta-phosphoglucomutase family hydrolase [Phycisphaerae bacterium]
MSQNDNRWMTDPTAPLPPEIKGLIFDCDGTLLDTMPAHYSAWLAALGPAGIEFPEKRFYSMAGIPTVKIAQILVSQANSPAQAEQIAHNKEQAYIEKIPEIRLIESVVAIVRREQGQRRLAVASGGLHRVVDKQLQAVGFDKIFPVVVCADDVQHGKPAPDTFLMAAKLLGVPPENCVVYEDAEPGIEAARAADMTCIDVRQWH